MVIEDEYYVIQKVYPQFSIPEYNFWMKKKKKKKISDPMHE